MPSVHKIQTKYNNILFQEERLVGRYLKRKMKEDSEEKGSKDARKKFREVQEDGSKSNAEKIYKYKKANTY